MPPRSFQLKARRSPWPGETLTGRMPRGTAKIRSACALCVFDIKPGQRIGVYIDAVDRGSRWAHLGCVVREVAARHADDYTEDGLG